MASRLDTKGSSALAMAAAAAVGAFLAVKGVPRRHGGDDGTTHSGSRSNGSEHGRGRSADVPEAIPPKGLRDVFWRVVAEISTDRVLLVAAGVTFYLLLSLFPALTALVSLYGLIADPTQITENLQAIGGILPPGATDMVAQQIHMLVERQNSSLGFAFFIGLGIALWSAHSGVLSIFDAMNVAYEEEEGRGFVRLNIVGLVFTICTMFAAAVTIGLLGVMPAVLAYARLDQWTETLALVLRWPILLVLVFAAVTAVYRFGPSRDAARFRWLTWGAGFATIAWFVMSVGFSFYLSHFADYNATYGTLGALIGFLIWTWLSVAILIIGAELNSELEHQTAKDTTKGQPQPMGARSARVADTLGKKAD